MAVLWGSRIYLITLQLEALGGKRVSRGMCEWWGHVERERGTEPGVGMMF
jgi:hypothetical protein